MKILMISGSYPPIKCGVGDYTHKLVQAIRNNGCEVKVLTSDKIEKKCDAQVYNCIHSWNGFHFILQVIRFVKKGKYDVVHIQFPTTEYGESRWNYLLPMFLRLTGTKVVYTFHEFYRAKAHFFALAFSKKIIIVDDKFKQRIQKKYKNRFESKISVVHIGSNIPKSLDSQSDVDSLRKEIINNSSKKIISYFGFMGPNKKIELILEALNRLKVEGKLNSIFMIVGDYYATNESVKNYQEKLKDLIRRYNINDDVYITGFLDENVVGKYLRTSDAVLLLFEEGVSPRNGSYLAAAQEGIPVFTTKPQYEFSTSENTHFINNAVEDVYNVIEQVQEDKVKTVNFKNQNETWNDIAKKHVEIYEKV